MYRKLILFFVLTSFILTFDVKAFQGQKNVVLLQGRVLDYQSGESITTSIQFVDKNGKKIQTKSVGENGSYQQVLNLNEQYNVMFKDYILMNEYNPYKTPNANEYLEIHKDFKVKKVSVGLELSRFNAFNPNEANINQDELIHLLELKDFLLYNPKVNLKVVISTGDSYFKSYKKKVDAEGSGKKKKTKTITVSSEEQLKEFAEKRINTFKEYMRQNGIPERLVAIETDLKSSSAPSADTKSKKKTKKTAEEKSPKSNIKNVVITINKILNL